MADWYCSSVKHAAVTQWAAGATLAVGAIRRQLVAPSVGNERCFRVSSITTGITGGSEPSWNLGVGATTTDGGVTWTEVTGNSTYFWTAPAARLTLALARAGNGSFVYVGSDHAETQGSGISLAPPGVLSNPVKIICVDVAGSTPPVAADVKLVPTGTVTTTGAFNIAFAAGQAMYSGLTFTANVQLTFSTNTSLRFDNCILRGNNSGTAVAVGFSITSQAIELNNTSFQFNAVGDSVEFFGTTMLWKNSTAINGATIPSLLLNFTNATKGTQLTCDGIDFSAAGSGKTIFDNLLTAQTVVRCLNCKFHASATVVGTATMSEGSSVSFFNCTGTSLLRSAYEGTKSTEATIIRTSGANDGVAGYSWKVVTTANTTFIFPFVCFPIAIWNTVTGSAVTATIEVVNDGTTLTNAEIWVEVEYMGAAASGLGSMVSSFPATVLTAATNVPASSVTWTTTGLGSPIKQYLQVSFTPQVAGLIKAVVKVAKASKTLYIDPKITLT